MDSSRKNVFWLSLCQGLLVTNNITVISLGSLAGYLLADDKSLSTLPATAYIAGGAIATMPIAHFMKRSGRRAGFVLGAGAGLLGAALCTWAMAIHSFWLFCLGTLVGGIYTASGGYYRFAAADHASEDFKSKAISLVLAGGILGGIIGPETSKLTKEMFSVSFLGSYASLMVFALLTLLVLGRLRLPLPSEQERNESGRALVQIARQPVFIVACLGAVTSYAVMNLLMGTTPLAMQLCGLPYPAATLAIELHIIGMFAPAFFTGRLIQRFGALKIMAAGVLTYLLCVVAAVSGQTVMNFWLSGTLLGVGWCFLFIASTSLLTEAYRPAEKTRAQGLNDFLMFLTMGVTSAVSGAILHRLGWNALNYSALPLLLGSGGAIAWLAWQRGKHAGRLAPPRVAPTTPPRAAPTAAPLE